MSRLLAAGVTAGLLGGCGTIVDSCPSQRSAFGTFEDGGPHIYGGVEVDAQVIFHSSD